jgi:hypothetical protein
MASGMEEDPSNSAPSILKKSKSKRGDNAYFSVCSQKLDGENLVDPCSSMYHDLKVSN